VDWASAENGSAHRASAKAKYNLLIDPPRRF
jgi:hypothetical protein